MPTSRELTVLQSIESDDGLRCVDIFIRADGSFGAAEYRKDFEDKTDWRPIGSLPKLKFPTQSEALTAAHQQVAWLRSSNL